MIKKNLKIMIITSVIIVLPILIGVMLWGDLPAEIPNHWNLNGEIDGWSSKPFAVIGMPLIMLAIHWITMFIMYSDPKNKDNSNKMMQLALWIIPVLSIILAAVTYFTAMGKNVHVELIVTIFLGVTFIAIGNYMPKCRQSYTVGIKLPWTLSSEENWNKTHRLGGWVFVGGGILMIIFGMLNIFPAVIICAGLCAVIPILYSGISYYIAQR